MEATTFDNKTVERFIKVRAMATNEGATDAERAAFTKKLEKMETQSPGITAHVDAEMQKLRNKEQADEWIFKTTGQAPLKEPGPNASWFEKAAFKAYKWGLNAATKGMTDDEWSQMNDAYQPKKRKKKKAATGLKAVFWEEIGVGDVAFDTDDNGEFIHIDMDIPIEVWDKIMTSKTGSARFCEWIEELTEGD